MPRSTSTAVTVGPGLGQCQGQRAEAGTDLDDVVAGPTPARRAMRRTVLGSADEVLAEARGAGASAGDVGEERRIAWPRVGHHAQ